MSHTRAMPYGTILAVFGSWLALAALTGVAWRFNRHRGKD